MLNEVTLTLDASTQLEIEEIKRLQSLVNEKEFEASKTGIEIDYSEFSEYTELHNLYSKVKSKLADLVIFEIGIAFLESITT